MTWPPRAGRFNQSDLCCSNCDTTARSFRHGSVVSRLQSNRTAASLFRISPPGDALRFLDPDLDLPEAIPDLTGYAGVGPAGCGRPVGQ
jgi:hypothetical protein